MDEYQSDDSNGKMGWFWSKEGSIWKKLFVAGFVIMSAPFVLPPLVVASMILVLSSIPYGLFLVTYACTEKLMSALLPSTASPSLFLLDGGGDETWVVKKDPETRGFEGYPDEREGEQIMIEIKGGGLMEEDEPEPATDELLQAETNPIVVAIEGDEKSSKEANIEVELNQSTGLPENEELVQETRSSMENTKDEGNRGAKDDINEKAPTKEDDTVGESDKNLEENKGEEIQEKETKGIGPGAGDNIRKDLVEGTKATDEQTPAATGGASTHSSSGKDADEGSDEPPTQSDIAPRGTGEEKRKNTDKKKKKTGRPGTAVR